MGEKSLTDRVAEWLGETGYPLEMHVAQALRDAGFVVRQSAYYDDGGTFREVDVIATKLYHTPQAQLKFVLVVECKTSRARPWVVFRGDPLASPGDVRDMLHWGPANEKGEKVRRVLAGNIDVRDMTMFKREPLAYGMVSAKLGKPSDDDKGGDQSYAALMQVSKAVVALTVQTKGSDSVSKVANRYATIGFPVIVLDGHLFSANLKDGEPEVKEIKHCVVDARHPETGDAVFVSVATKGILADFVLAARSTADAMAVWCRENPAKVGAAITGQPESDFVR
jgi:hypothetical protein